MHAFSICLMFDSIINRSVFISFTENTLYIDKYSDFIPLHAFGELCTDTR